jgi:hypothetical protein
LEKAPEVLFELYKNPPIYFVFKIKIGAQIEFRSLRFSFRRYTLVTKEGNFPD